ncbi:MAG: hypothetical protein JXR97_15015 [Planctomycetes bacterium]|nr:hypothetical protein [Planctomycetota bacterium]
MLRELKRVRQVTGCIRRWFDDDYMDLIVWYNFCKVVTGFQLCYDKGGYERALTWIEGKGFSHNRIDDGESGIGWKATPVLLPDGEMDKGEVKREFDNRSGELDMDVRLLVRDKLNEYCA